MLSCCFLIVAGVCYEEVCHIESSQEPARDLTGHSLPGYLRGQR